MPKYIQRKTRNRLL